MDGDSSTFLYFAYGSNMLTARLTERCPSARPVALAQAMGYDLAFTKRSNDTSGKATLATVDSSHCPGVIFEIATSERDALDAFEGPDYARHDAFVVTDANGAARTTTTYLAQESVAGLKPYDWYLALIVAGCREHGLDAEHTDRLHRIPYDSDLDTTRKTYLSALRAFKKAEIDDFRTLLALSPELVPQ